MVLLFYVEVKNVKRQNVQIQSVYVRIYVDITNNPIQTYHLTPAIT
jgi:hypothetical protein